MRKFRYPLKAEKIVETSDSSEAKRLCDDGYAILAVRVNHFIEDDDKFQTEFMYCLAKPEDIDEED